MYTRKNFPTKKALKEAVKAGFDLEIYQPGPWGYGANGVPDGTHAVEGPHFPEPHKWYASVVTKDGIIVRVN